MLCVLLCCLVSACISVPCSLRPACLWRNLSQYLGDRHRTDGRAESRSTMQQQQACALPCREWWELTRPRTKQGRLRTVMMHCSLSCHPG